MKERVKWRSLPRDWTVGLTLPEREVTIDKHSLNLLRGTDFEYIIITTDPQSLFEFAEGCSPDETNIDVEGSGNKSLAGRQPQKFRNIRLLRESNELPVPAPPYQLIIFFALPFVFLVLKFFIAGRVCI